MRVQIIMFFLVFLSCFVVPAYAEENIDVGKFMAGKDTGDFEETLWKFRITSHMIVAKQKAMNDFASWCSSETKKEQGVNHTPCQILSQEAPAAEIALIEAISVTKMMIQKLQSEPSTKQNVEHLNMLNEQLQKMESTPTPFHNIMGLTE